jgi:predicted dehydrogenase
MRGMDVARNGAGEGQKSERNRVKTYRCAIIGLTNIASGPATPSLTGGRHPLPYSHASALAMIPNARVVAVCELVPAMAQQFLAEWSETWGEMHVYSDYREMLEREEIDILSVCTPDNKHATIVVDAADRGVPAIFCEKPLATTLADADRMIAAVERNGTVFSVDHTRRWDPYFHRVKEIIDAGMIGTVRTVVGTMHGPRAMLFRNGTHIVDLMNYYAGAAPTHVFAKLEEGFEGFTEYRGDGGKEPESEPGASGFIMYANGVRGFFNGTKGTYDGVEWDVTGSDGRIRINGMTAELWGKEQGTGVQICRPFPATMVMKGAIQGAFEEIIDILEHGGTPRSTARDARMTVAVLLGMLASQQRGNALIPLNGEARA